MTWSLIWEHLFIVLASAMLSVAIGLPLGIWAYVSKTARPVILRVVDLLQTIPSLALLGIILFRREGIMGTRELTWGKLAACFRRHPEGGKA